MKKLIDYTNKCGSCELFERLIKDGQVQEHGQCNVRGKLKYHNSSQKCCRKYKPLQDVSAAL